MLKIKKMAMGWDVGNGFQLWVELLGKVPVKGQEREETDNLVLL